MEIQLKLIQLIKFNIYKIFGIYLMTNVNKLDNFYHLNKIQFMKEY